MSNTNYVYDTDNSNDRSYAVAEKDYLRYKQTKTNTIANNVIIDNNNNINSFVNINYLKSGIYFNTDIQKDIGKKK